MKTISDAALRKLSRYQITSKKSILEDDIVTIEEPLQIRILWNNGQRALDEIFTITMRTPGDDHHLTIGLLLSEGIIKKAGDISKFEYEVENDALQNNQINITLADNLNFDLEILNRRLTSNSSCGLCGKTSLKSLEILDPPHSPEIEAFLNPSVICQLPETLAQSQGLFQQSGGIHAAGLFTTEGNLISFAEDIGRHNALDKLLGKQLLENYSILGTEIILLSGRASFELVQKAIMAGYAVLASVGAPSSLAIEAAKRFNLTLIGFVNNKSINVYTGMWRLIPHSNIRSN